MIINEGGSLELRTGADFIIQFEILTHHIEKHQLLDFLGGDGELLFLLVLLLVWLLGMVIFTESPTPACLALISGSNIKIMMWDGQPELIKVIENFLFVGGGMHNEQVVIITILRRDQIREGDKGRWREYREGHYLGRVCGSQVREEDVIGLLGHEKLKVVT